MNAFKTDKWNKYTYKCSLNSQRTEVLPWPLFMVLNITVTGIIFYWMKTLCHLQPKVLFIFSLSLITGGITQQTGH